MRTYKFLSTAVVLSITAACGVDHSNPQTTPLPGEHGSAVARLSDTDIDLQPTGVPRLTAATKRRLFDAFVRLEASGALNAAGVWQVERAPTDMVYAQLTLRDDADRGIMDGYAHLALVPAGVRGRSDTDPNLATAFFLQRVGGVAGMTFSAGPFELSSAPAVVISESDQDRVVDVKKGDAFAVQLNANPSTGFTWSVATTPPLPAPQQGYVPSHPGRPGAPGLANFTWDTNAEAFAPDQIYTLTFSYSRSWEPGSAARTFVVNVRVVS